jgi:hypothetical protein
VTAGTSRPLAADGAVTIDAAERTLVVKPAKDADGYARLLWRAGHRAGRRLAMRVRRLSADRVGQRCRATKDRLRLPGDDGTMRFHFPPGDPNYRKLVSTPGLTATIVVDRENSHILGVSFRGRRSEP